MLIFGIVMLVIGIVLGITVSGMMGVVLSGVGVLAFCKAALDRDNEPRPEPRSYSSGATTYNLTSKPRRNRG